MKSDYTDCSESLSGELLDAESVEDFEAKMTDYENAKAAVDAVMTGQVENENAPAGAEAGERSFADAQDDSGGTQDDNGKRAG